MVQDERLLEAERAMGLDGPWLRYLYLLLPTQADCNGVFPLRGLQAKVLSRFDQVDLDSLLTELEAIGFLRRFNDADGEPWCVMPWFHKHQTPHKTELPRYPIPAEKLIPITLRGRIRGRARKSPSQDGQDRPILIQDPDPDPDPDHGSLIPPTSPAGGRDAPAARGGIDLSVYDQASQMHFGRGLVPAERKVLSRFLAEGHDGGRLLELMALNRDKAADTLLAYAVATYHNGGGHVPKPKRAKAQHQAPASNPFDAPEELPDELDDEAAAEHRRLLDELHRAAPMPEPARPKAPAPAPASEMSDEDHRRNAERLRSVGRLAMGGAA